MDSKTPSFRIALSLAVLWLPIATIYAWVWYENTIPAAGFELETPDMCNSSQLVMSKTGEIHQANPTEGDVLNCNVKRLLSNQEYRENLTEMALQRAIGSFLVFGVLPAGLVLLLVGYKNSLFGLVRRYFRWIKGGDGKTGA